MMNYVTLISLLLIAATAAADDADFSRRVQQASTALEATVPASIELMNSGDFEGANAKILATFPEANRTAAESFLLGNVLFETDREQSYALHYAAALAAPDNMLVIWEWGFEQHRAGEYAGALAAYQQFSKSRPRSAVSYALQADCLLHLNRLDEAIDAWRKSEDAPSVKAIHEKHHLLIDPQQTIRNHGGLLSAILNPAIETKAIDDTTLKQQIGPKVLELARKGKDAQLWNVALLLSPTGAPQEQ